jgi:hypothetical protein
VLCNLYNIKPKDAENLGAVSRVGTNRNGDSNMKKEMIFILFLMITVYTGNAYTREQHNGGPNGYNDVSQGETYTDCYNPGNAACPPKEDWQHLTTSEGIVVDDWCEVDEEVKNDMLDNEVPDRDWNCSITNFNYIYTGIITSNYYSTQTGQFVYRTAVWTAISRKDYSYEIISTIVDIVE